MEQNDQTLNPAEIAWHALDSEAVLSRLGVSLQTGLSEEEAARRMAEFGPNQLAEKEGTTLLQRVIGQLNNFLVILLIVAAVISFLLGDTVEAAAILAIVVLNTVLGIVQEGRAEQELAALKKLAAPEAHIIRGGHRLTLPATQLVPGDVVFLEAGNFIPADLRLIEAVNLRIDEAALTGESVARQKDAGELLSPDAPLGDRENVAFMGTTTTYGRGRGVVTNTGMGTELGKIAGMLQSVEQEETPLQKRLEQLGKLLGWGSLAIVGLVFIIGVVRALSAGQGFETIKESFIIAVSLAIAAVPEGLPAVVTISLALGMREMIRRHALIRRLSSVETLGSATVICSDKTGTLTQNEMTITRYWVDGKCFEMSGSGYTADGEMFLDGQKVDPKHYPATLTALWVGTLNNDAQLEPVEDESGKRNFRIIGDPTEASILVAAAKTGASAHELARAYPRKGEIPFDSARKRMVTIHAVDDPTPDDISPFLGKPDDGDYAVAVKGAPDIVLELCTKYQTIDDKVAPLTDAVKDQYRQAIDSMTQDALRVLGMAYRMLSDFPTEISSESLEKELIFAGLVGMIDPAREEVRPALRSAKNAGIRTIMITGDYPNTARAIATDIGLLEPGYKVLTGANLNDLDDPALKEEVTRTAVFARVSPEHKMRIVEALRDTGEVVAMTGDGVNDAPAIKRADIGVAMGITGTDVTKETADMVLTDDNYASIVSAIEQGRIIYSNIRKFVYYLLSCNLAEIATIFIATLFGWKTPLTALQLLWLNLLTDGAPALALAAEKGDPDIMEQPPRPPDEPIINRNMRAGIVVQTIAITAVTLIAYFLGLNGSDHVELAQTMAFVTLSTSELFRAYTARSEYFPLLKIGIFSSKWMNYAVLGSFVLILLVLYIPFLRGPFHTYPLTLSHWAEIAPLLLFPSVAAEVTKYILSARRRKQKA